MNDNDLLDRMTRSTAWTEESGTDSSADLARGRARLRRRRVGSGVAVVLTAAVAVTGITLGTSQLDGQAEAPVTSTSPDPTIIIGMPDGRTCTVTYVPAPTAYYFDVLASHLDAGRTRLKPDQIPQQRAVSSCPEPEKPHGGGFTATWEEAGGIGVVYFGLAEKGAYGPVPANAMPGLRADQCLQPSMGTRFTSCRLITTDDGKQVRVGTTGSQAFWASYVRPDGALAVAMVDGNGRNIAPSADPADTKPIVAAPSVTLDALIAAVTDPAFQLETY
jgi:hypothetical protein